MMDTFRQSNINVRCMFVHTFFTYLQASILTGAVFDKYIKDLVGTNATVGKIESISGLTGLFVAFPVGYLVDRFPRVCVARYSVPLSFVSSTVFFLALFYDSVAFFYLGMVLSGTAFELNSSATEALFTDSVDSGSRSKIFTYKYIVGIIAGAVAPVLMIIIYFLEGNEWEQVLAKRVLGTGYALTPMVTVMNFYFYEPNELRQDKEEIASTDSSEDIPHLLRAPAVLGGYLKPSYVPYLVTLSDFVMVIGAGMSVRFFSLFFAEQLHFSPIKLNFVLLGLLISIGFFSNLCQKLGTRIGRAQASIAMTITNALLFFVLSWAQSVYLIIPIFLIRGGLANAAYPIDRSIIMDYVLTENRGKWNAVETMTSSAWSGSAFIGGFIADWAQNNFQLVFFYSATIYLISALCYIPLLYIVPRNESNVSGDILFMRQRSVSLSSKTDSLL